MDRREIKKAAWEKIKGNKWNLLWPLLLISFVENLLTNLLARNPGNALANVNLENFDVNTLADSVRFSPVNSLIGIVFAVVGVAYMKYLLNFVRKGKMEFNDIIECLKEKWLPILILTLVYGILVGLGFVAFIIPGIILTLCYAMASYLIVDTEKDGIESLKKSRAMMKGYKWDYFVFELSFIGWYLLIPFTLGIILIWIIPYVNVANAMYYEKLKEVTK